MSKNTKKGQPEPMDPAVREAAVPVTSTNKPRDCWAIKTLVAEVTSLFPETSHETSNYDGRNTALDVTFDLSMVEPGPDLDGLIDLLVLVESDERVREVIIDGSLALVSFRPGPRTQDIRDPFDLDKAWDVLCEKMEMGS